MILKSPVWQFCSRAFLWPIVLSILAIPGWTKDAVAATPLQTHNLNPLTLIYGLPLVSPARLATGKQSFFSASYNFSNTLNAESVANEVLFIDGQTDELNLIYSHPINDKTRLRFRLPLSSHRAGSLDSFIDDFHDAFGFPGGERPNYPTDQFLFSYTRSGQELLRIDTPNRGIGDLSIDLAYQLSSNAQYAHSLWASIKLPTGDEQILTGSGKADTSIWLAAENNFSPDWSRYYNIGLLLTGKSSVLSEIQKNEILFGTAGLEWRIFRAITLNIQLDFHTAFYQSKTTFLGDSVQISSGGHIKIDKNRRIDIVVVEDIYVGASPDVTFQLGYSQFF